MSKIIQQQIPFLTAKKFLDAISPNSKYFKDYPVNSEWLFRGQGQDWKLMPSLFRTDEATQNEIPLITKRNLDSYQQRLLLERDLLLSFFEIADRRGFLIPDDSQDLRSKLNEMRKNDQRVINESGNWVIAGKVLSLVAITQHYGAPTRLLDWTMQPLVAAYFAAEDAARRYSGTDKNFEAPDSPLVVWAFYFPKFGTKWSYLPDSFGIKSVTAPTASNPNLKAQSGVFTLVHPEYTNEKNGDYLEFDLLLERISNSGDHENVEGCRLLKLTLPVTESFELLKLLAKFQITPSSIYPNYYSIIDDIKNQLRWERYLSL